MPDRRERGRQRDERARAELGREAGMGGEGPVHVVNFADKYSKIVGYERTRNGGGKRGTDPKRGRRRHQREEVDEEEEERRRIEQRLSKGSLELRDVRREVESLGELGLGKKQARGKKPRVSAKIGLGIAKKKAERERKAKELARETGMLKIKKTGKKGGKRRKQY